MKGKRVILLSESEKAKWGSRCCVFCQIVAEALLLHRNKRVHAWKEVGNSGRADFVYVIFLW